MKVQEVLLTSQKTDKLSVESFKEKRLRSKQAKKKKKKSFV